jgi:hypothetical protein
MKLTGENRSTRGKYCPSVTLSTKIPHGLIRDRTRGGGPATNRLSHGTAKRFPYETYINCLIHCQRSQLQNRSNVVINVCLRKLVGINGRQHNCSSVDVKSQTVTCFGVLILSHIQTVLQNSVTSMSI